MGIIAPDVLPEPINPPRIQPSASLETFGGGQGLEKIGAQSQKISSAASEIADFEKIRADQTATEEAVGGKLAPFATKLQNDAIQGITQANSHDQVLKIQKDSLNNLDKFMKTTGSGLNGPEQIGPWNKAAYGTYEAMNRALMAHVSTKQEQLYDGDFKSGLDNFTAQKTQLWADQLNKDQRDKSNLFLAGKINNYKTVKGLSSDETQDLTTKVFSNFYASMIHQALTDKQDIKAKELFDATQDKITDPKTRELLQKSLEEGSYRGASMRSADSIWQSTSGNLQSAYAQADKEKDPELRDRIHQRLREKDNEVKEARTSDQDNAYYESSKVVGQAVKSGVQGTNNLMDTVGPDRWIRMSPSQQDGLKRMWTNDQNSDQVWTNYNLTSPTDKAAQSQSDFETEVLSRLDKSHRDKAMSMRNAAMSNNPTSSTDSEQAKLIEKSIQESGIVPGFKPGIPATKLRGDAASSYGSFQDQAQKSIADFEKNELGGRRRASLQETQKIVDQQIIDQLSSSKTSFFTTVSRTVGLSQKPTVLFDQIPDNEKESILTTARKMGKAVTKEQIENAYSAALRGDAKGISSALQ